MIRLDRPKLNALNAAIQRADRRLADECGRRGDVAAVVLTGGERVFAAGADIKEMQRLSYAEMVEHSHVLQRYFAAVARIPKPVAAAVNGYALGGGCELALCADVRIAADDATFGQPEIKLGIIPGAGGTQRLTRLIGPAGPRSSSSPAASSARAEALSDRTGRPGRPTGRGAADRDGLGGALRRRSRAGPQGRQGVPSIGAARSISTPAWRSSGRSSPPCSPPRTGPSAWPRSSSTAPARRASSGADLPRTRTCVPKEPESKRSVDITGDQLMARTLLLRASWVSSTLPSASSSGGTYIPNRPR